MPQCGPRPVAQERNFWARFEVTASIIRRDVVLLNGQGRLAHTYGGAADTRRRHCDSAPARRWNLELFFLGIVSVPSPSTGGENTKGNEGLANGLLR